MARDVAMDIDESPILSRQSLHNRRWRTHRHGRIGDLRKKLMNSQTGGTCGEQTDYLESSPPVLVLRKACSFAVDRPLAGNVTTSNPSWDRLTGSDATDPP